MKQEIKLEDIFNDEKRQGVKDLIDAHKQETLEEAAEQFEYTDGVYGFKQGVKWQQEQNQNVYLNGYVDGSRAQAKLMYNEEDMAEAFIACWKANVSDGIECKLSFKEWFEQFKKK